MAIGIGLDLGEKAYSGVSQTFTELGRAVYGILEALLNKRTKTYHDPVIEQSLKIIMDHIKNGGDVRQQIVDAQDASKMGEVMKEYRIPFVRLTVPDGDEKKCIFLTRDTDDAAMEAVWKRFSVLSQVGLNEVTAEEFINAADKQNIKQMSGLKREETELFRQKMAGRPGSYAFVDKGDGTFQLLCLQKDWQTVDKALKDTMFDFAGEAGDKYRAQFIADINSRDKFLANAVPEGNETYFVVDAYKPNEFISVTADGFRTHSIQHVTKKGLRGEEKTMEDIDGKQYRGHGDLLAFAQDLRKPVIVTAKEMYMLVGIGKDGKAILPPLEQIQKRYKKMQEKLEDRPYYTGIRPKAKERKERIYSLDNLSPEQIGKIYTAVEKAGLKDEMAVLQDSIAYPEKIRDEMQGILGECIFEGLKPMERIEEKVYLEGRGRLIFSEIKKPEDTMYLIDTVQGHRAYVLAFTPEGLDIMAEGKTIRHMDKTEPDYEKQVATMYEAMKEPVVLSKHEMEAEQTIRDQAIADRLQENQHNEAKEFLADADANQREQMYSVHERTDAVFERMNSKQREALASTWELQTRDIYVDRSIIEQITTLDFSRKLHQEETVTETRTSSQGMDI